MEFRQDEGEPEHGSFTSAAMRERVVRPGFDPTEAVPVIKARDARPMPAGAHDPAGFRHALVLPDDPAAMTLEELDRLIAYHDALRTRYEEAVTRLDALRDQIEAMMREHGGEVVGDLRGTRAGPLRGTWIEALAEYTRCRREIEAIGAYAEPLQVDQEG
jgi:hypothetical protein